MKCEKGDNADMELDRLQEFTILAEEQSLKKAAERLGIAPNVLSMRMHSLEDSLNTKLFKRVRNGIELTETGNSLSPNIDSFFRSYTQMTDSLSNIKNHTFQTLNLQFCAHLIASEMGPYLDIFCRKHPQLLLNIYDENTCLIRGGLKTGKVDISFVVCREHDFEDIAGRIPLSHFPNMYVYLPLDHSLANEKKIHFSDLMGETFILYPNMCDSWTRDLQVSMLDQSGIVYQIYDESSSPFFFDLLVPIGKGVRLWNWREENTPNTVLLPIMDSGYDTYLYMLYDTRTENPAVLPFINGFLKHRSSKK